MQAIETKYKGYRFRSRLEARWAVCFDCLGIAFDYEAEGYKLDSGACYLPDFYLRDLGVHVEVKPKLWWFAEYLKLIEFAREKPLLLIVGSPGEQTMHLLNARTRGLLRDFCTIRKLNSDDCVLAFPNVLDASEVVLSASALTERWVLVRPQSTNVIAEALDLARGARFEHGERPDA